MPHCYWCRCKSCGEEFIALPEIGNKIRCKKCGSGWFQKQLIRTEELPEELYLQVLEDLDKTYCGSEEHSTLSSEGNIHKFKKRKKIKAKKLESPLSLGKMLQKNATSNPSENFSDFKPSYNDEWIYRGLRKHQANFSMVICFDSDDPVRLKQLKEFFCTVSLEEYRHHKLYIYDLWHGLGELNKEKKEIRSFSPQVNSQYAEELGEDSLKIKDLGQCLNKMDTELRKRETIFIIHGMSSDTVKTDDKSPFISALKAWATSDDLIRNRSLVILLGSSFLDILDEETKNLIARIEVPLAKDSEYEELIGYLANLYGIFLNCRKLGITKDAIRGLNLYQAEALLRETYALKKEFDLEQIKISKGELVKKTGILEIEEPKEGFEVIGGYQLVKKFIEERIIKVIYSPDRAKKFAIPLPRGILLFGPPGTGKTLFAKSLAKAIKLPFINFRTENIYSMWLGESGRRMKSAIRMAEQMSPAIVFIDEIDRFGKRAATSDSAGEETRRVFSQVLEWLGNEDRRAIIIGTTNKPDDLDEAFLRTGRFDYKIPILYPDKEARLKILCIHLGILDSPKRRPPLALTEEEFAEFLENEIVPKSVNCTGAELEELVNRAKRNAFEKEAEAASPEDFQEALSSFRIDPGERERQKQEYEELAKKYTDDKTFL